MAEDVLAYFKILEGLTNEELDRSAQELVVREKGDVADCIAHITEIKDRDYHLELRYKNIFEYCTKRLKLSEGSVYRRLQVSGVCRRFPQILEALSRGRLHLTAASLIAPHIREDNVEELLSMAEGKTRRQIEDSLATLAPKAPFEPSVRKQPVRDPMKNAEVAAPEGAKSEGNPSPPSGERRTRDLLEPATEERYNFRFSAGKEFTEKFNRLAEVLGVENPHNHLEEIFEQALESALDKKDPKRKLERRRKREAAKQQAPCPGDVEKKAEEIQRRNETSGVASGRGGESESANGLEKAAESPAVTRHVPAAVRERVLERAGYQCEYCGPDGSRCSSRTGLHVEHTKPFAVYHSHDEQDLRAFCPAHNLHAAKKYYSREFIEQKIEAARSQRSERARVQQAVPAT